MLDREGDERLYYHQNTLYSVFALTNADGSIVEGFQYDAYGRQTIFEPGANGVVNFGGDDITIPDGTGALSNPCMYTGRRLDAETGLYLYRNRYYDAQLGRFMSRDEPTSLGEDFNLYEYVGSSPVDGLDPLGLKFVSTRSLVRHLGGTLFGKTQGKLIISATCVCKKGKWGIRLDSFIVRSDMEVRTHFYDRWEWDVNVFPAKIVGRDEFRRLKKNLKRTYGHEMKHRKHIRDWHDANEAKIRKDLDTGPIFATKKLCGVELLSREMKWHMKFKMWAVSERQHEPPNWPSGFLFTPLEKKPKATDQKK